MEVMWIVFVCCSVLLACEFVRSWRVARRILPEVRRVGDLTWDNRIRTVFAARRQTLAIYRESRVMFVVTYVGLAVALVLYWGALGLILGYTALILLQGLSFWVACNHDSIVEIKMDALTPEEREALRRYMQCSDG